MSENVSVSVLTQMLERMPGVAFCARMDPATGQIKEFTLPTKDSGPHGLVADKHGVIWYTGNRSALIGQLDPKTGVVLAARRFDVASDAAARRNRRKARPFTSVPTARPRPEAR